MIISMSRILAVWQYYHAPMTLMHTFEYQELPHLFNLSGLLPTPPSKNSRSPVQETRLDLTPIKDFDLTLCLGKEWYRFPGHYLVPNGIRVDFIQSDFKGLLPGHFPEAFNLTTTFWPRPETRFQPQTMNDMNIEEPLHYVRLLSPHPRPILIGRELIRCRSNIAIT